MKFIKNALVGIAIYEAAKYLWNNRTLNFATEAEGPNTTATRPQTRIRKEETNIISGASQDHLQQLKENAKTQNNAADDNQGLTSQPQQQYTQNANDPLETGSNPDAGLTGQKAGPDQNDPWKNSLADDELRAPDS